MMNNVMLVGRLANTPELFSAENGRKGAFITIAVSRPYKNQDGEYEADFIDCALWTGIAESTVEYCKKGDTIGVRGKLQSRIIENEDGTKYKKVEVVADRISFISSKATANKVVENISDEGSEDEVNNSKTISDVSNDNTNDFENKHNKKKNSKE